MQRRKLLGIQVQKSMDQLSQVMLSTNKGTITISGLNDKNPVIQIRKGQFKIDRVGTEFRGRRTTLTLTNEKGLACVRVSVVGNIDIEHEDEMF